MTVAPPAAPTGAEPARSIVSSVSAPGNAGITVDRTLGAAAGGPSRPSITSAAEIAVGGCDGSVQRPSFSMRIGTGSYRARSRCLMMEAAEATDTSCSPDRPP